jgi:polysaccharide export outer membrane protein
MSLLRTVPSLVLAAASLAGCVSTGAAGPAPGTGLHALNDGIAQGAAAESIRHVAPRTYVLEPPDVLSIDVRGEPDLSAETVTVGPDGRIHRPLIGGVDVSGRTVEAVTADLRRRYERYIRDVEVAVSVVAFRSKHVFVTGEVRRPGRYAYTGSDRVLDVLADAGFLTRNAAADDIRVARKRAGFTEMLPVRLRDVVESGDGRTNWLLEPGDVIQVPPGFLARVAYTFHDLLAPVAIPIRVHADD